MAVIHVVDDEASMRMLVSYVLRSLGHQVEVHASADEFFSRIETRTDAAQPLDLVMTDFIMPRVDGFEFCRRLRADARVAHVPVIVMTGFELEPVVLASLEDKLGVAGVLHKPFLAQTLIELTKKVLAMAPAPRREPEPIDSASEQRIAQAVRAVGTRLQPRIRARLAVTLSWDGDSTSGHTYDVSGNGMLVIADRAPEPMQAVTIAITMSQTNKTTLSLHGSVAHVRTLEDGTLSFGVALQERRVQSFYAWYQLIAKLESHRPQADVQRSNVRAPAMGDVRVLAGDSESIACALGDIGTGGMRLFGDTALPPMQPVIVQFSLPNDPTIQQSRATVRWMNKEGPRRLVFGLAFEEPEAATTEAIARYVNEHNAQHAPAV